MSVLRVSGLKVSYPNSTPTYRYPLLTVEQGKYLAVVGPTGSGKSTLINALFQPSFAGRVRYDQATLMGSSMADMSWPAIFRILSYLPQHAQSGLSPSLTIAQHLAHITEGTGRQVSDWQPWLNEVQLSSAILSLFPHQLSGGMKQRLLLMMGMVKGPKLYVLDEPSTAVDAITLKIMVEYLQKRKSQGLAVLLVSHERGLVQRLADEVISLEVSRER